MCTNNASFIVDYVAGKVSVLASKTGAGGHSDVRSSNGGLSKSSSGRTWRQYEIFIDGTPAFDSAVDANVNNIELRLDDSLPDFADTLSFREYASFLGGVVNQVNTMRSNLATYGNTTGPAASPKSSGSNDVQIQAMVETVTKALSDFVASLKR